MRCLLFGHKKNDTKENIKIDGFCTITYTTVCARCNVLIACAENCSYDLSRMIRIQEREYCLKLNENKGEEK